MRGQLVVIAGTVAFAVACGSDGSESDVDADISAYDAEVLPIDAAPPIDAERCAGDTFECDDGQARVCEEGYWSDLGDCPLGCDVGARACRIPSNVSADLVDDGTGDLVIPAAAVVPTTIDADTGEIAGDTVIRPAGVIGLHEPSGISYQQVAQEGAPGLGVFSMNDFEIESGTAVEVVGSRALVILLTGDATIDGTLSLRAEGQSGGPGGYSGGVPTAPGSGPCPGLVGYGENGSYQGCASGSGGGGHGGAGGAGAASSECGPYDGGEGGASTCGTVGLIPLVGGSGGGGGTPFSDNPTTDPGPGGGGGGAVQISAVGRIDVGVSGGVDTGGGGGGESATAGGTGGGAGGGILFEAPTVTVAVGGALACNGGGGGAGD